MFPGREHPNHLLRDLALVQEHLKYLMLEDGLQLFQFQRRSDAEHPTVTIETAVRDEGVTMRIESEEVAERLHGNDGAGNGFILRH